MPCPQLWKLFKEMKKLLYIGEIAKETGIPQKTLRYYEELGLLPPPMRTKSGYRIYNSDTRERLAFIKKAQRLGLTLSEIKQILDIYHKEQTPCSHVQKMLGQKISEIDAQIKDLLALQRDLREILYQWESTKEKTSSGEAICPHIQEYSPVSRHKPPKSANNSKKKGSKKYEQL